MVKEKYPNFINHRKTCYHLNKAALCLKRSERADRHGYIMLKVTRQRKVVYNVKTCVSYAPYFWSYFMPLSRHHVQPPTEHDNSGRTSCSKPYVLETDTWL